MSSNEYGTEELRSLRSLIEPSPSQDHVIVCPVPYSPRCIGWDLCRADTLLLPRL